MAKSAIQINREKWLAGKAKVAEVEAKAETVKKPKPVQNVSPSTRKFLGK